MSSGLYSGVSGLAIGSGLYKGVSGLWSGASGLVAGWGNTIWSTLGSGLTVFHDLNNTPVMKDFESGVAVVGDPAALVFDSATWYGRTLAQVMSSVPDEKNTLVLETTGTPGGSPSYNTTTGVYSLPRVDATNLARVAATGRAVGSVYQIQITAGAGAPLALYTAGGTAQLGSLNAGLSKTFYAPVGVGGRLEIIPNANGATATGTITSVKLVPGCHMSQTTLANRPILRQDSLTGAYYLQADGTNDIMQTRSLDLSGTDKLGVFAAQRTTSIAGGLLLENSISSGISNGAFAVFAPMNPNTYGARVRGTSTADIPTPASYAPPNTGVLTLLGNLAGPTTAQLRVNGAVASSSNTAVGGGTFGNYQVFYFARSGGTVNLFTGNYYGDIIYSGTPTTAQIEYVEAYYNALALPPQLQLSFTTGVLDSRITFTRSSTATFVGSNGLIQTAATNTPRFDYDPNGNLLTYSEQFDNAAWSKSDVTVTANTTTSPDGTANADSYVEGTAGTASIGQIFTGTANATFTVTIYVKRVNTDWVRVTLLETAAPTNRNTGWFNLSTGAVGSFTNGGTGSGATGSVSDAGNGWYRLRLTGAVNNSATALSFYVSSASADNSGARVNNAEYRLWGAQLQEGPTATAYIPTTATAPVRTIKGLLLEEQRTNLLTYSEQFDNAAWATTNITVTANAAVSPDGATTADKLDEGAATGVHSVLQSFTSVSGQPYAVTFYLKNGDARYAQIFFGSAGHGLTAYANFDLQAGTVGTVGATATASMTYVGNGIYRCGIVATATASTAGASAQLGIITDSSSARALSYTGANKFIYAWGAQLEADAFASSYIPTVASQVTRTADVATMTGTNFSSWYNQTEGTFVVDGITSSRTTAAAMAEHALEASTTLRMVRGASSVALGWNIGSTTFSSFGVTTTNLQFKSAAAYKATSNAASLNASAPLTDAGSTYGSPTSLGIGCTTLGAQQFNGYIRQITYYNTRLTNAQLQAVTA